MQDFTFKLIDDGSYCVTSYQGDEKNVTVPAEYGGAKVTVLYDGLFAGHKEITSVEIPDAVTDFGEFLFDGCDNLKEIRLPLQLRNLWGYTFVRSAFKEIVLPDGVSAIPPFAFKDCKNLEKVVCGKGLKEIRSWAFAGCDKLTTLIYEPSVKVSREAFSEKELNT